MRSITVLFLAITISLGCGPSRTPAEAVADLRSPNPETRMIAARDIESGAQAGLTPDIIGALLQSAQSETDPKTKGAVMIALGYTGIPEAKPLLDQYVQTNDRDQRRWGARALKKWAVKAGQVPPTYEFPDEWPFGTPGYPPPLPPAE
jgi:hypothetical protein